MKKLIMLLSSALLFACFDGEDECEKMDVSGNYGYEIPFGTYYRIYEGGTWNQKIYLQLNKDSSFKLIEIENGKDTVSNVEGTFAIRPVKGEKWHSFVLNEVANRDTVLLDVQKKDSCFSLGFYNKPDTFLHCSDFYKTESKLFCATAAFRDSVPKLDEEK